MKKFKCGVIGTGWMAKAQLQALSELSTYHPDLPEIELTCVTSRFEENYKKFAQDFGFKMALPVERFWEEEFDHLIVASPCHAHLDHLMKGLHQDQIKQIYCEKPLVANSEECLALTQIAGKMQKKIQVGFQFLQIPAIQKARDLARNFGRPIHFKGHYLKSGYLAEAYRVSRADRLLPAPCGGVTSDLASHVLSLLISILGEQLVVKGALKGGSYPDVDPRSDLHTQIFLQDTRSNAVGIVTASRVSAGHDDELGFSIHFENGALEFSTSELNTLRVYQKGANWQELKIQPQPRTQALVTAFSLFFSDRKHHQSYVPDLKHGLQVQKLVNDTVAYL